MAQPYQPASAPEGPAPGVRFASSIARLIAYWIDGLIAGIAAVAIMFVFGSIGGVAGADDMNVIAGVSIVIAILGVFIVTFLYFPYFWSHGGQTPGAKLMRIRVVRDEDGGPIGWGSAILRLIGYYISIMVFYIGFLWILVDKRKRGWHDLIAGTCVVRA